MVARPRPCRDLWFFGSTHDTPFFVTFCIYVVVASVGTVAYLVLTLTHQQERARLARLVATSFTFLLWLLFEFSFMCGRLHHFMHNRYQPWELANGGQVHVGPGFDAYVASNYRGVSPARSPNSPDCYISLQGATPSAPCHVLLVFHLSQDFVVEGYPKFSMGLGLILFLVLQFGILAMHIRYSRSPDLQDGPEARVRLRSVGKRLARGVGEYVASALLGAQQALVLLPLTTTHANGVCASLQVRHMLYCCCF